MIAHDFQEPRQKKNLNTSSDYFKEEIPAHLDMRHSFRESPTSETVISKTCKKAISLTKRKHSVNKWHSDLRTSETAELP